MNKQCYRIVFNQARQMLMVVCELAKHPVMSVARGDVVTAQACLATLKPLVWCCALAAGWVSWGAQAEIVADNSANGHQQPTIIAGANGTPQINIQTPNKNGVSHNKYQQFDVDGKGAILNNSAVNTQTQLGGLVTGNPWLAKGEASVILNEVNSANPSRLNGFVEVAGKRADVIIANPSGITCSGCGFINANKTTLAAAQVLLEQGNIAGFQVKNGQIAIQGNGMNDAQSDYTQLIARAVNINAKLHAKDLSVTTGKNRTDANGHVLSTDTDSDTAPEFAIDVASLGGMYANKIKLVGTENGVGVRNAGQLGAQAGEFTLSASGKLQNTGHITANNVALDSQQSIDNSGVVLAQQTLTLNAQGAITNTHNGQIIAGRDATLRGEALHADATSLLAAGVDDKGKLTAAGTLTLSGQKNVALQGQVLAKDSLRVTGTTLDLSGVNAQARDMTLRATEGDLRTRHARMLASQNATFIARGNIDNQGGNITAGELSLSSSGSLNNRNGRLVSHAGLSLDSQALNNAGGVVAGQTQVRLRTGLLDNRQGTVSGNSLDIDTRGEALLNQGEGDEQGIFAQQNLTLNVGALNNHQGHIQGNTITLNTHTASVDNTLGEILAGQTFDGLTGAWDNQQGRLQAGSGLTLNTQGHDVTNDNTQHGGLLSGGDLTLSGGRLSNAFGQVQGAGALTLTTAQVNNQHGQLIAGQTLTLNTQRQTLDNQQGTLAANGAVRITAGDIDNAQGVVQGLSDLTVDALRIDNTTGTLLSQSGLRITGTALDNTQGVVQSKTDAAITLRQSLNNTQGKVLSGQSLTLGAQALDNTRGVMQGTGDVTLTLLDALNNTQGWIKANGALALTSATLDNRETAQSGLGIEGQSVQLDTTVLNNQNGAVRAAQAIQATVTQSLNNDQGMMSAGTQMTVSDKTQGQTLALSNDQGVMVSNGTLDVNANQMSGAGKWVAQKKLTLSLRQAFENSGKIQAGETLVIHLAQGLTNSGLISSLGDVTLTAASLVNTLTGEISSAHHTAITTTANLQNTGLIDGITTTLQGASLDNLGTGRIYGDVLTLVFNALRNDKQGGKAAVIAGRQSVNIAVSELINRDHALIYSDGDLVIGGHLDTSSQVTGRAGSVKNHSANIEAAGNLTLKTDVLDNRDIHLQLSEEEKEVNREHFEWFDAGNGKRYKIQPRNGNADRYAINDDGTLNYNVHIGYETSNRWRMFEYGNVTKDFYQYVYDRITYETQLLKQDAALITSGKNLTLDGKQLNNTNAHIVAGQDLTVTGSTLNNTETQGVRRTQEVGTTHYLHKGGGNWHTQDSESPYQGVNNTTSLSLSLLSVKANAGDITKTSVDSPQTHTLGAQSGQVSDGVIGEHVGITVVKSPLKGQEDVVIKTVSPSLTLPDNSLFTLNPNSDSQYLVETDPRFTNKKKWLSSLDVVNSDQLHKRLGDGYYEQRLVRDQLIAATGQRLLGNYQSDEEQYAALLNAGVAFGQQYHLTPGIALSAEQMAALTTDIVWMVNKTVTLPNGQVVEVSVPQVYVRVRDGDATGQGALLSGRQVSTDITGALLNSGEVSSRTLSDLRADTIENRGQIRGQAITLNALKDINNIGGDIRGVDSVSLNAGRDIVSDTEQRTQGQAAWLDRPASIYVTGDKGQLTLNAQRNVNLIASDVGNTGEGGKTTIHAGQDINLGTREVGSAFDYTHNANNYYRGANRTEVGTNIHTQGDLTLTAGLDLTAKAANVNSGGTLAVKAGRDVNITAGEETADYAKHTKHTDKGLLSSTTKETHDESHTRTAVSGTFQGESLHLSAGHDVNVSGSNVLGTQAVNVEAGHDLNVGTVDEADHSTHMSKTSKSGLMSSGGIGFTVGQQSMKQTTETDSNQKKGSVVGSSAGSVTLKAGNTANIHGSDVIAAKDINVTGSDVHVRAAENSRTDVSTTETKQRGLTVSLGGAVGSALNTAYETGKAARDTDDGQLKTLQSIKAGLKLEQANQAEQLAAAKKPGSDASNNDAFGVNLSYGSSASKSVTKTQQKTASGSSLSAGDNLTINATGKGEQGNIVVQGSSLTANKDITLNANNNLTLTSAANTQTVDGKNSNKGSSVGVGITAGKGGAGWNVNASVNKGSGFEKGNSQYYTDSEVTAGKTLTMNSGKDTTLAGAQAKGETVKATVGGNLTLSSQQATDTYDSKQQNVSVSGSGGMGNGSFSANASKTAMHSDYQSVDKQTGIEAGKGGFDITVGHHTQLDGAMIGSQAEKAKNRLDTGTLGFSDIKNHADYKVEQQSVGVNSGGAIVNQVITNSASALLAGVNNSGNASNTTHSAVSDGAIIIRDTDKQTQAVDDLSRDTANAHEKLGTIFDKDAEQKRIDRNQALMEIGQQIVDIAATQAEINARNKVNADKTEPTTTEREAAIKALQAQGKNTSPEDVNGYLREQAVQTEINRSGWGVGGDKRRIVEAGTALIQGLASGDVSRAVANASAPYLANAIAKTIPEDNQAGRLAAHAIANVALALVKKENALAQAAGAVTAEAMGMLSQAMYNKKVSQLTEDEKATISAYASLAAGIAGGLAGGSTQDALNAAQAGKTTVENNALSGQDAHEKNGINTALSEAGLALHPRTPEEIASLETRRNELNKLDAEIDKYINDACSQGKTSVACQNANDLAQGLKSSYSGYVGKLTYQELNGEDYAKVSQIVANTAADKWDYAIDNYAKSQNISYQEAKDKFALVINVNQAADIAGILYGLKGSGSGTGAISASAASTLKQVLSKYDEFKQNIATTTKGDNTALATVGAGNNGSASTGNGLSPNTNLATGSGSGKPSGAILQQQAVKKIDDLATQFNNPAVHPKDFQLNINGKTMVADPQLSLGAPVFKGATDADVMTYFKQLAGAENMPSAKVVPGKGTVYSIKVTEGPSAGSTLTLRDFSTSAQQTGAKWTIDLTTPSINGGRRVEVKFK